MRIDEIVKISALLLGLIVIGIITGPAKGAIEEGGDAFDKAAAGIGDWGCENINKQSTNSVTFDDFMKAMYDVYNDCNDPAKNICGANSCKSMTLDLGSSGMGTDGKGDGTYRKITDTELENANPSLNMFNNYLIDAGGGVGGIGANIYCETKNADWNDYEIDAYYKDKGLKREPTSGTVYWIKALGPDLTTYNRQVCVRYSKNDILPTIQQPDFDGNETEGLFAVADGSKVTIKAAKPDEWGGSVDLKVTVDGGKYITLYTPPVTPVPTCTTDANCNAAPNPPWRYCGTVSGTTTKNCMTYGYCSHVCPLNVCPSGSKCISISVTCTLGSSCTDATNPSLEYACANGLKIKTINKLETGSDGQPRLDFDVVDSSKAGGVRVLKAGEEKWFKDSWVGAVLADPADKDAKMSVAVTEMYETDTVNHIFDVTLLQGCY